MTIPTILQTLTIKTTIPISQRLRGNRPSPVPCNLNLRVIIRTRTNLTPDLRRQSKFFR